MFNQQRFYGIVEDIKDPLEACRVRVRVFFYHTAQLSKDDTTGIPTNELLWFSVSSSVSGNISGIGRTPVGIKCGSIVYGEFRDEFKQDGIVMGTLHGFTREMPDFNKGFCDPNKVFPIRLGSDVNIHARTIILDTDKLYSGKKLEIHNHDVNTFDIANVNIKSAQNQPTLKEMLTVDCGYNNRAVFKTDHFVVGIGHKINKTDAVEVRAYLEQHNNDEPVLELTVGDSVVEKLFNSDLSVATNRVTYSGDSVRRNALIILEFHGYFTSSLTPLLIAEKYRDAYELIPNNNLLNRARVMLLTGDYVSYSNDIVVPKSKSDTQYPNNDVYQSENGFFIEIDDTPNAQRYRFKHPSNSFYEYSVDGSKVEVLSGSDYCIIKRDKHLNIQGDFNITINGNNNIFVMGDVNQTVIGDVNEIIHGDNIQTIHGDVNQVINGDVATQETNGDILSQTVNGNAVQLITGNNKQTINGNNDQIVLADNTQTISGNNTQTISGVNTVLIEKTDNLTVNESQTIHIKGDIAQTVDGNVNQIIKGNVNQTVDGNIDTDTKGDYNINAKSFTVNSQTSVKIEANGPAQMSGSTTLVKASGTSQISGATILLN